MKWLLCIFLCLLTALSQAGPKQWLPKDAKVVFSSAFADGFLPDGGHRLKTKITDAQFQEIVKQLGWAIHSDTRKYTDDTLFLNWGGPIDPVEAEDAWNPTDSLEHTYVRQEGDIWEYISMKRATCFIALSITESVVYAIP